MLPLFLISLHPSKLLYIFSRIIFFSQEGAIMKSCLLFLGLLILATIGCKEKKEIPVAEKMNNFWVGDTSTVVHGIDVSYHQFEIDWKKVKEHGVSFVFVKATEGVDYLDSMFVKNWKQLEEENMLRAPIIFIFPMTIQFSRLNGL